MGKTAQQKVEIIKKFLKLKLALTDLGKITNNFRTDLDVGSIHVTLST